MNDNKNCKCIINSSTARHLIKLGYRLIDIKPHKTIMNKDVFVFENDNSLELEVKTYERNQQIKRRSNLSLQEI